MRILFFGDLQGEAGITAVQETLPEWRKAHRPDVVLANVENVHGGKLATPEDLDRLREIGIDAFTTGDHFLDRESADLARHPIVRPMNIRGDHPVPGYRLIPVGGRQLLLANIAGHAFISKLHGKTDDYFRAVDALLGTDEAAQADAIFIDFHAETTSEFMVVAYRIDGKASALVGTHTHVPSADARVLAGGTAIQFDAGMCGGLNTVIGMQYERAEAWLRKELGEAVSKPPRIEPARPYICDAVLVETDGPTKSKSITRLSTRP
ncbi:MAG: YmdB family metallophosphoesterase [Patescibacteria group bacterium]